MRVLMMVLSLVASGCGSKPSDKNLPPSAGDLGPQNLSPDQQAAQKRWDDLAAALAIPNNQAKSATDLAAQLATPSAFLTDATRSADYQVLLKSIAAKHVASAYATRCAAVVGVRKLRGAQTVDPLTGAATDLTTADLYVMQYKLQKSAAGNAEDQTRSGLLVVPNVLTPNTAPIVAFGHGGDSGLSYVEIARTFGAMQANHVIVAPAFPGEVLCLGDLDETKKSCVDTPLAAAQGVSAPYDTDVDELLGMQDCVARASLVTSTSPIVADPASGGLAMPVLDASGTATAATFNAALGVVVRRHAGGTFKGLPISIVSGSSRGGLVANIALAKTGGILSTWAADQTAPTKTLGAAYLRPSLFSCSMTQYPPSTLTAAEFRLALELVAKGQAENSAFIGLPSFIQLNALLDDYRKGTMTATAAAVLVAQRDATLSGPYVIGALRNWSKANLGVANGGPGVMAIQHGVFDKVVPFSQTKLAFNIFLAMNANSGVVGTNPSLAPGIQLFARPTLPAAKYLAADGTLSPSYSQHADLAYFDSASAVPADFVSPTITGTAFTNPTLEATAKQLSAVLGKDLPTARALMLTGQTSLTADGKLDDTKNLIGLRPDQVFAAIRSNLCETALNP